MAEPAHTCRRCNQPIQYAHLPGYGSTPFNPEPEPEPTEQGYIIREGPDGIRYAYDGRERRGDEPTYAFHLAVCPVQLKPKGQHR